MSIFNDFFKKEKPVFTGLRFGFGSGGGGGAAGDAGSGSPFMTLSFPTPVENNKVTAGNYTWYQFTASGAFTVTETANPSATNPDNVPGNYVGVMMVGGGGSGGTHHGAGGGGGGLVEAHHSSGYGVIDLGPGGNSNPITIKIGAGGFGAGGANGTTPGVPGQATRFGSPSDPYFLIAYGGGGGGSHDQPNYVASNPGAPNPTSPTYSPMGPGGWDIDDTGPPTIAPVTNRWWSPYVNPGTPTSGQSGGGAGPRSGGCGGGEPWPGPDPNPSGPTDYGSDGPGADAGGPGRGNQPLAPGNSQTYGVGYRGGNATSDMSGGGGGTAGEGGPSPVTTGAGYGAPAKTPPNAFWSGDGGNHPFYPSPRRYGAGGGGQSQTDTSRPGGTANPGSGGAGGGSDATGYGNGGGGGRPFSTVGGDGSAGILYIKVRTS